MKTTTQFNDDAERAVNALIDAGVGEAKRAPQQPSNPRGTRKPKWSDKLARQGGTQMTPRPVTYTNASKAEE
jgi:hypothetical protein